MVSSRWLTNKQQDYGNDNKMGPVLPSRAASGVRRESLGSNN